MNYCRMIGGWMFWSRKSLIWIIQDKDYPVQIVPIHLQGLLLFCYSSFKRSVVDIAWPNSRLNRVQRVGCIKSCFISNPMVQWWINLFHLHELLAVNYFFDLIISVIAGLAITTLCGILIRLLDGIVTHNTFGGNGMELHPLPEMLPMRTLHPVIQCLHKAQLCYMLSTFHHVRSTSLAIYQTF